MVMLDVMYNWAF